MRELRIGSAKARTLREALSRPASTSDIRDPVEAVPGSAPDPVTSVGRDQTNTQPTTPPAGRPEGTLPAMTRQPDPNPAETLTGLTGSGGHGRAGGPVRSWPVLVLAAPAWVAIWSGWVGLGGLTGFGSVHPLPGIADGFSINTAITLPVGVETYAAYALRAWLSGGRVPARARRYARWSAIGSLLLGAAGQVIYHLMTAAGVTAAPWPVTTLVSCLPVAVLGMGAALAHLLHADDT
jgi:hypothetical protein